MCPKMRKNNNNNTPYALATQLIFHTFIVNGTLCFHHCASSITTVADSLTAEGDSDSFTSVEARMSQ